LSDLLALARKVTEVYEDPVLDHLHGPAGDRGVCGEMKNRIFVVNGPKRYVSSQMRHRFLLFPKLHSGTDTALCHCR